MHVQRRLSFTRAVETIEGILAFEPIESLSVDDADTLLISLDAQGIGFTAPVDDPWFSAHEKWLKAISSASNDSAQEPYLYLTDEAASTIGCT